MDIKRYIILFLIFLGAHGVVVAQQNNEEWSNLGLKMGLGAYSFYGDELKNPTPMVGYVAGLYYHTPMKSRRINLQTGLDIRFRGGNFSNAKPEDTAINTAYTKISLVTLDIPLQMLISLNPSKKEEALCAVFGANASYLFRSVMYTGPNKIPLNQAEYMQTWEKLPLSPIELQLSAGIQQRGPVVGYSLMIHAAVNNLNNNFKVNGISPATGNGLYIGTWSIEASLLF